MAKVHPQIVASNTSSKQEVFTLWMKSLIFSSNGCAVFDSSGQIVYRVDNYSHKCTNEVYIMDSGGKVLLTIAKKKFSPSGMWVGYRSTEPHSNKEKPRFRLRKRMGIRTILAFLRGHALYKVRIRTEDNTSCEYLMENQISKVSCKIVDSLGGLVAEVRRKVTESGVILGEDVLSMVAEPHVDHSIIVGLVVVLGLIHHKL